ncbi:hypothetical protein [Rhodopseudomonas palustris]|uniref:hypothetical protein n=1 Tax=Rhodopseudomonas palustris TaxID=1076 RepID=UPI001F4507A4|nr:hypothetical protein [Rhodopseudomonas palustris]
MRRRNDAPAPLAATRGDADMAKMKRPHILLAAVLVVGACGGPAAAQVVLPGAMPSAIPPPAPPPSAPPPVITVPKVPQLAAPPPLTHERIQPAPDLPKAQLQQRGHFGDRISRCLDEGAAMGLNASERAAYSRACANQ